MDVPSVRTEGPATFGVLNYTELPEAMTDLRAGFVKAVLYIPPNFTRDADPIGSMLPAP